MKALWKLGVVVLLVAATGFLWVVWKRDAPRRQSLATLERLQQGLASANSAAILDTVSLPAAIQGRTAPEQTEFLTKALHDEISAEGLAVLRREGQFGSLTNLFPADTLKRRTCQWQATEVVSRCYGPDQPKNCCQRNPPRPAQGGREFPD